MSKSLELNNQPSLINKNDLKDNLRLSMMPENPNLS